MLNRDTSAGFTLVEVMVTVFVVAIGLLAAAGLQAVSKKAAVDALQRTTASVLAQDMLERLRSNASQISTYAARGASLYKEPTTTVQCGNGVTCTPDQLVDFDLQIWWSSLEGASETIAESTATDGTVASSNAGGLRYPVGCIRVSSSNVVDVVIAWRGMSLTSQEPGNDPDDATGDPCGTDSAIPANFFDKETDANRSFRRVLRLQAHLQ